MKEAIPPDFSINVASFFCKDYGSDFLALYFFWNWKKNLYLWELLQNLSVLIVW